MEARTVEVEMFRKNLSNMLISKGLSLTDIAKTLGISHSAVSRWVNGRVMPNATSLTKLANIFGVSPSTLLKENVMLSDCITICDEEKLLHDYRMLSETGKKKALERIEELTLIYWYDKEKIAK